MSTHLCKENCLGSYTTECSLKLFFDCHYFIGEAHDIPGAFETRKKQNPNHFTPDQIKLIDKLKVISLYRLHITVTDVRNTFGSVDWGFSYPAQLFGRADDRPVPHFSFFTCQKETYIGLATEKLQQITFTCRDCLDKAIAEPLEPTLPRGVVAIVQGYL